MLVKDALKSIDESNPQGQLTQDMRLKCEQVARELRVVGDALETRSQRILDLEAAHQENHWRIELENLVYLEIIKELLFQILLNLLITWRD